MPQDEYLRRVKGVHALCIHPGVGHVDQEVLETAGPQLKVVGTMSVGYDHIDVAACKAKGVKVGNTPYVLSDSVAEHTICLALMVLRRVPFLMGSIVADTWKNNKGSAFASLGASLHGKTVGIIGLGGIGKAIAERLIAFKVNKVIYNSRTQKPDVAKLLGLEFATLDNLLSQCDLVITSCDLNESTKHILNREAFKKMKKSAIVVNISRGPIIEQHHLIEALQNGEIAGAGLDVMTPEPLPFDHPLTKMPNVVLTPHMGSATWETRMAMGDLTVKNIIAGLQDQPLPAPLC
ncbi:hypothetical protein TCAL_09918 [Tigriopus californicus]|uniref:Glyoxylate reductase/hydroxypyruvate reductase n=1 Tax=Tigriopus californicus TaxID=6832 RepID=A0A553P851_TIGCA|nr:hypothetical protein TCAL_09918 [Tigriopus californicus]|eukprot:TCALIF_09918-PA protein Name:"Similar to GRHPR Glyoxylate reductase/hydroxypyruvate reductase (Homo sapiens)" AED:0.22 eAED:0.22 QI:0/0.8/0.66/1/0.8/0.83/6/172/291